MILRYRLVERLPFGENNLMQYTRQVDAFRFPVVQRLAHVDPVNPSDHFLDRTEAHIGHDLAQFFGDKEEIVDHIFRLTGKLLAQFRILRGNADRASVEMTFAHHDTTGSNQRRCGKAEFVGTQ